MINLRRFFNRAVKFIGLRLLKVYLDCGAPFNLIDYRDYWPAVFKKFFLRQQALRLQRYLHLTHFPATLMVSRDRVMVMDTSGIALNVALTNRYLAYHDDLTPSGGKWMADLIQTHGIAPKVMIDVGANYGDVSMYFAKRFPGIRVLAIEGTPDNFTVLNDNLAFNGNFFDTRCIVPVCSLVSDRAGTIKMAVGMSAENSIITDDRNYTIRSDTDFAMLPAERLDVLAQQHGFSAIDFIKIDIEGAEPLLKDALVKLRAKAMNIEFSRKNSADLYRDLYGALMTAGYVCFDEDGQKLTDGNALIDSLKPLSADAPQGGRNLTFVLKG